MNKDILKDCPVCGRGSVVIDVVSTINPMASDKVELRSCGVCGHWWHSPVPSQEQLNKLYNSASPFVVTSGARACYQNKNTFDAFHTYVLKHVSMKPGNYLEVGAGGGGLLRRFRAMSYTCYGVDPGQWVEDKSIVSNILELPQNLLYDVFVLQDVLEHIVDPVGLLTELKKISRKGSVFFCSFPCNDSRQARKYIGRWPMVRPYGHLHYFSLDSARKMFSFAGLNVERMCLERTIPISKILLSLSIRQFLYEVFKGGKDQLYVQAVVL